MSIGSLSCALEDVGVGFRVRNPMFGFTLVRDTRMWFCSPACMRDPCAYIGIHGLLFCPGGAFGRLPEGARSAVRFA